MTASVAVRAMCGYAGFVGGFKLQSTLVRVTTFPMFPGTEGLGVGACDFTCGVGSSYSLLHGLDVTACRSDTLTHQSQYRHAVAQSQRLRPLWKKNHRPALRGATYPVGAPLPLYDPEKKNTENSLASSSLHSPIGHAQSCSTIGHSAIFTSVQYTKNNS